MINKGIMFQKCCQYPAHLLKKSERENNDPGRGYSGTTLLSFGYFTL